MFGPDDEILYVDHVFYLKFANLNLESFFFSTFVIFIFHGPTLGHISGHVGTCHMVVQQMKIKGLGKLICSIRELFPWESGYWPLIGQYRSRDLNTGL